MPIDTSRRRWLVATALAGVAVPLGAQESAEQLSAAVGAVPIASRLIRLESSDASLAVVTAIAADPRGEFVAAAGDDHTIRILDAATLQTTSTLRAHRDMIRSLAFDPRGKKLVSAGNDGQLIVWDRDRSFRIQQRMQGTPALTCVRFAPLAQELAAVGFGKRVYVIGRGDRSAPALECGSKDLRAVAYRGDMQVLAVAGRSGELHLFNPHSGKPLSVHSLHRGRIDDLAFQEQTNHVVSVGEDGCVTVFDTERRKLIKRIVVTSGKLFSVAVLSRRLVAVAGSDNVIRIVDTKDGSIVRRLEGHAGSISTLAAAGGMLFSGSYDATLRRWAVGDLDPLRQRIADGDPSIDR